MRNFPILFLIIFLGALLSPLFSSAGEYTANGSTITYEGLVPCGRCLTINPPLPADEITSYQCGVAKGDIASVKYISCQVCHLFVTVKVIIDFVLVYIIFPIATLLLIAGGLMFFFYAENPKKVDEGKTLLTAVVIGLVLIFSAWLVVGLFLTAIGLSDFALQLTGPDKWFIIDCEITL